MNKNEIEICEFEMHSKNFFGLHSNLSNNVCLKTRSENGYEFQRSGLKTGVENYIFWSEVGSGFGEPGGTPPLRIPKSTFPLRVRLRILLFQNIPKNPISLLYSHFHLHFN